VDFCGHRTGLLSADSMGLVDTSLHLQRALATWRPKIVVMLGICGGRPKKTKIGDIIIPDKIFHYQFGAYSKGNFEPELLSVKTDPDFIKRAKKLIDDGVFDSIPRELKNRGITAPRHETTVRIGPLASADLVVKDLSKIQDGIEMDRKLVAIEMEAYAAARCCELEKIPFLVIKAVQDTITGKHDKYRKFAMFASMLALEKLLPSLLERPSRRRHATA